MRHMSCDQITPIISFHTALQSGSAGYSKASEKGAS